MLFMPASFWEFWEKYGRFGFLGMGLGLVILGVIFSFAKRDKRASDVEFLSTPVQEEEKKKINAEIVVDVAGAVEKPGIYRLKSDARINEAIEIAAGFSSQADQEWISQNLNLARKLSDGQKIYIPKKGEGTPSDKSSEVAGVFSNLININLASQSELETLSGIGSSFAQRIIEYRQKNGGFKTIEEIMAVPGIGKKTFEKIKEKISV